MFDLIGVILLVIICTIIAVLYLRNAFRLVRQLNTKDYGIIMIARVVGICLPVWGVIMGFVSNSEST